MLPIRLLDRWSVATQQQARRNAMVAATRLARRRAEWNEVAEVLATPDATRTGTPEPRTVARDG